MKSTGGASTQIYLFSLIILFIDLLKITNTFVKL